MMMSKQTAISAAASVFAMASFALLSPQSQSVEALAQGHANAVAMQADMPYIDLPLPQLSNQ